MCAFTPFELSNMVTNAFGGMNTPIRDLSKCTTGIRTQSVTAQIQRLDVITVDQGTYV